MYFICINIVGTRLLVSLLAKCAAPQSAFITSLSNKISARTHLFSITVLALAFLYLVTRRRRFLSNDFQLTNGSISQMSFHLIIYFAYFSMSNYLKIFYMIRYEMGIDFPSHTFTITHSFGYNDWFLIQ